VGTILKAIHAQGEQAATQAKAEAVDEKRETLKLN
jgi:hypothetical protein